MTTKPAARKVNRLSLSCHKCKARKVKCNKEVPCSSCVRRGCEDECSYGATTADGINKALNISVFETESTGFLSPDSLGSSTGGSSSNGHSRTQSGRASRPFDYTGVNLYHSKDEQINFYKLTDVALFGENVSHQGPLSWSFIQHKDIALGFNFEYTEAMKKRKELMNEHMTPAIEIEHFESTSGQGREKEFNARKNILNVYALCADDRPSLCMRIRSKLPKRSLLRFFFATFIEEVSPFMSFIDPCSFKKRVSKIIGPLDSPIQNYPDFECNLHEDLIYLGMLFITLRLGYLALLCNSTKLPPFSSEEYAKMGISEECQSLMETPIDLSFIELAEECFKKFNLLVKPSLELLQFALMIRVYQKTAPEFGEGLDGGDSQLFTGVLVQMAVSIGLNRDPDSIPSLRRLSEEDKNIRRHIWFTLTFTDVIEAYSFGNPICCHVQSYDTKIPKLIDTTGSRRIYADSSAITHCSLLVDNIRDTLKHVLDISGRSKVSELCQMMSQLEVYVAEQFLPLESYYSRPILDTFTQKEAITNTKVILSLQIFYLSVDIHLFWHYAQNANQELSYFYVRKLLSIELLGFVPYIFLIIMKSQELFGNSANLIIIPVLLQVTHRVFLTLASVYLRLKFVGYAWVKMNMQPPCDRTLDICDSALHGLDTIFDILKAAMGKLSHRYYYAYKMGHIMNSCLETARDENFYASYYPGAVHLRSLPFPVSNLTEINEIIQLGLTKVYDTHRMHTGLPVVLKKGTMPMDTDGGLADDSPQPVGDEHLRTADQKRYKPLGEHDIESFFSTVLSEVGEAGNAWTSLTDDALNFDFFHNVR